MKKFYCNGKIVYMHNNHTAYSAKYLLEKLQLANRYDNVCQALDQDQDMLDSDALKFDEVAVEQEVRNCSGCPSDEVLDGVEEFFVDMLSNEDYDHYVLPNGKSAPYDHYVLPNCKSAPYGLTGTELSEMKDTDMVYVVSLLQTCGFVSNTKGRFSADALLVAVDRDLIFATREKAVEAYNALFGDLYGTV